MLNLQTIKKQFSSAFNTNFSKQNDNSWLLFASLSVVLTIFISLIYSYYFLLICKKYNIGQELRILSAGLSMQFFMLTGVIFSYLYFYTGDDKFSESFYFKKWRFIYLPEACVLGIVLFFPLLIIGAVSYFTIEYVKKISGPGLSRFLDSYPNIQESLLQMNWHAFCIFACIAVFVAPVVEEIIFRRIIFSYINTKVNTYTAVIASSLIFATIHMNIMGFSSLLVLGIVFQILFIYHKSIYPSICYHAVHNATTMILLFMVKYFELPISV